MAYPQSYFPGVINEDLAKKFGGSLRSFEFIPILPPMHGSALLNYYTSSIGSYGDWAMAYSLFIYKGSLMALVGVLPSGLYDVLEGKWVWVENRSWYESMGGAVVDPDTETVAWASNDTPYVFIYDGSTVKMINLGENTGGNIVRGSDGNFYVYGNSGSLYQVTPSGNVTKVSTNPNSQGGGSWFAENLGGTLFFASPYPDYSIYAYNPSNASWTVAMQGTTAQSGIGYDVVQVATWDTLAALAIMNWPLPPERLLGFITFQGSSLVTNVYGILPWVTTSGDIWNISAQPLILDETQTVCNVGGILWLIGHPDYSWNEGPPGVRPLGGFFIFNSGITWKGDIYLGTKPLLMSYRGGSLNSDIQRFGGVIRLRADELFKLQLPAAKAVLWNNTSISAGQNSPPLVTMGWSEVTISFTSNTSGNLTVYVDPVGDGTWEAYATYSSITSQIFTIRDHFARVMLSFSAAATVTAKALLVP